MVNTIQVTCVRGPGLLFYSLPDEDRASLRIAHLANELLVKAKHNPISITTIDGERKKAFDKLRYSSPPLIDLRPHSQEWYEATPPGLEMSTAELLSKLIQPQYQKSKNAVENEKKWGRAREACVYLAGICGMLMFGIQAAYLPPTGGPVTFEPLPVRITAATFVTLLALAIVLGYLGRKRYVSNEIEVAVALYDAYSSYRSFIADRTKKQPLVKAQKLVGRAVELLEVASRKSVWATLAPELERIASIGQLMKEVVLPEMQNPARSQKMGSVLVVLARCFMESSKESLEIGLTELRDLVRPGFQPPSGRWSDFVSKSARYSHAHPYRVGGAISISLVLTVYVAWVSWITPRPLVPNEVTMLAILAAMASLSKIAADALKR